MIKFTAAAAAILVAAPAFAHTGGGAHQGFVSGFAHPLLGLDHLLAMVAVGLWAGLVGGRALWAWPAAFLGTMIAGASIGLSGLTLPGAETMIALSVAVLGLGVAMRASLPLVMGAAVCGAFALVHGFAHGAELPADAGVGSYVAGFTLATAGLHAAGAALGLALARIDRVWLPGLTGGAVAATGLVLLVS